jgi:hypothetical protein
MDNINIFGLNENTIKNFKLEIANAFKVINKGLVS